MLYESEEEKKQLVAVCDLALRAGGLKISPLVNSLLGNLKAVPNPDAPTPAKKK